MAPFVGRRHIVSSGHKLSRGRLEARLELPSFLPSFLLAPLAWERATTRSSPIFFAAV